MYDVKVRVVIHRSCRLTLLGHFLGNGSLIELLQKRGYDIQHTPPGEEIDNYNP